MSGFSDYEAQRYLNDTYVNGSTMYLALFVADPTDANTTANEVTGAWYARQAISGWTAPSKVDGLQQIANSAQIAFNAVTGSAVAVSHWGIYDAVTGGNLRGSDAWNETKTYNVADIFVVQAGEIILKAD